VLTDGRSLAVNMAHMAPAAAGLSKTILSFTRLRACVKAGTDISNASSDELFNIDVEILNIIIKSLSIFGVNLNYGIKYRISCNF